MNQSLNLISYRENASEATTLTKSTHISVVSSHSENILLSMLVILTYRDDG